MINKKKKKIRHAGKEYLEWEAHEIFGGVGLHLFHLLQYPLHRRILQIVPLLRHFKQKTKKNLYESAKTRLRDYKTIQNVDWTPNPTQNNDWFPTKTIGQK